MTGMDDPFLPYGFQSIEQSDIDAVCMALQDPYLTTGPRVGSFEAAFARACGCDHAISCANGTAALHLAAMALDLGPGDLALVPTMSFLASANGMRMTGADVAFIDCDSETGLVTPETFEAALASAPKPPRAAVVVHLNGNSCDMEAIGTIARKHNIALVEDACHAIGGAASDRDGMSHNVGSCAHSTMATFSLHPVKTVTMGEGGVVTTRDPALANRLRLLRSHGMTREPGEMMNSQLAFDSGDELNPWYYEMQELGYNYRVTDFQCALGEAQLQRLPQIATARRKLQGIYDGIFTAHSDIVTPVPNPSRVDPVRHLYVLRAKFGRDGLPERGTVMRELRVRGVGTMVHYIPIHTQPYYEKTCGASQMPGAEAYYADILSIPFYPQLNTADAERVANAVFDVLGV